MVNMNPKPGMPRPNSPRRPGVGEPTPGAGAEAPTKTTGQGRTSTRVTKRATSRPRPSGRSSAANPHARRPARSTNQNTVRTQRDPAAGVVSVGGLAFSVRALAMMMIFGLAALILIPTAIQWTEQKREYRAVNAEVVQAEARIESLESQAEAWNHRDYVASQARSRLGYVEKGETQFSVVDGPKLAQEVESKKLANQGPQKPWSLTLQKEILAADNPPPVREAIQTPTKTEDTDENAGE